MAYNPANLEAKLANINETQESITSISQYIMFHKRHADTSAQTWATFTQSAPDNKKLALVYLANEVVQQSKIKQREQFVDAFATVIPQTLAAAYAQVPSQVQDRINRVVSVWKDRRIFSPSVLSDIEARLNNSGSFFSTPAPTSTPSSAPASTHAAAVPSELKDLVAEYAKLNSGESKISAFTTKYEGTVDQDQAPAPVKYLGQLENLEPLLSAAEEAVSNLENDIDSVLKTLTSLTDSVQQKKAATEKQKQDLNEKATKLKTLKTELQNLINGQDEEPSPNVEPDSASDLSDADEAVEAEPTTYTAAQAQEDHVDEEPQPKKQKTSLDPKVMSFLAGLK